MVDQNQYLLDEINSLKEKAKSLEEKNNQTQQELEYYKDISANISDLVWTFDPYSQQILRINAAIKNILDYNPQEFIELPLAKVLSDNSIKTMEEVLETRLSDFIKTKETKNYFDNVGLIHKSGKELKFEFISFYYFNKITKRIEVVGTARDITKKLINENIIKEREEQILGLIDQSPIGMNILNPDGSTNYMNAALINVCGFSPDLEKEMYQKANILLDKQMEEIGYLPLINKAFAGETVVLPPYNYDFNRGTSERGYKNRMTDSKWFTSTLYPVKNREGSVIHVVSFIEDITERILAEQKIKESENKYRSIFEGSNDGIYLLDEDKLIVDCNSSFCKMLGSEKEMILGKNYKQFLLDQNTDWDTIYFSKLNEFMSKPSIFEIEGKRNDGLVLPFEVSIYKLELNHKLFYWGFVRDITNKKNMEKKIYSAMISAEEKERERYAKELHDGLGPLLSTSLIYIDAITNESSNKQIIEYSKRAHDIMFGATKSIKEISNNLSPLILKQYGLVNAVRSFIEKIQQALTIEFLIKDNLLHRFSDAIEFTIYRTLVELINNSIKYAEAKHVTINLANNEELFLVTYKDDGKGFNYKEVRRRKKGFGLMNIENRIKKINGNYSYFTSPGKGVQVKISFK